MAEQSPMKTEQKAKVTLYWLEKSRSQRILWLMEELKIEYELKTYKREEMLAPPELKRIHPLGKSPIVSVESDALAKPMVLAESGNIVEYLNDHFGPGLAPKRWQEGKENQVGGETEEWTRYRYFMHFAEGNIMTYLIVTLIVGNIKNGPVPFFIRPITNTIASKITSSFLEPNFKTHFEFLEGQISSSPNNGEFLCGPNLTGADIMMSFPLSAARGRTGFTKEKYPALWKYVDVLEARPAFKVAVQKIIGIEGSYSSL